MKNHARVSFSKIFHRGNMFGVRYLWLITGLLGYE
jgi:hypothetical protein